MVKYTGEYDLVVGDPLAFFHGPPAVLYRSFDTLTGLGLMVGSEASSFDALVLGKVNRSALVMRGKPICLELFY